MLQSLLAAALLLGPSALTPEESPVEPRKVVLIAGPITGHPKDTHEYERSVTLLRHLLETSPSGLELEVEAHYGGWPQDPATLEDADTVVLISDGGDHRETDHPLYVGERFAELERALRRGCGFVHFHWTTFHPHRLDATLTELFGGYFDYESGPPPRHWRSTIETRSFELELPHPEHPVARGVEAFRLHEEFYTRIRFAEDDPRWTPIASVGPLPEGCVGWAVQRDDGGRAFGFTGGHFFSHWWLPGFRRLILNAIAWTAGAVVPDGGVDSVAAEPRKAWIVTGHHHPGHDWRALTEALIQALEQDPRVRVEVSEDPEELSHLSPDRCDVVVLNYNNWDRGGLSRAARQALLDHVEGGGGLSLIHFANGAFTDTLPEPGGDWPEWRQRVVPRVWVHGAGRSGHDAYGPFRVEVGPREHPITRGLADFDTVDELYYRQEGRVDATPLVFAASRDTGRDEPLAFAHALGSGRVFQTLLGHSAESVRHAAALIRRGSVWAAKAPPLSFDPPTRLLHGALVRAGAPWTVAASREREQAATSEARPRLAPGRFGAGLAGELLAPERREWRLPPLSVEAWCRLDSKARYNILLAQETKASGTHWELFTEAGSGRLAAYFPGREPDHLRSEVDVCDGAWHHVTMVYEADRVRLCVDGAVVADGRGRPIGRPTVPGGLALGRLVEGGLGCDGVLDEVRIRRGVHLPTGVPSGPALADAGDLGHWSFDAPAQETAAPSLDPGDFVARAGWEAADGVLRHVGADDSLLPTPGPAREDSLIEARIRVQPGARACFGLASRVDGERSLVVRYYDQARALELLEYGPEGWERRGRSAELEFQSAQWFRLRVATVGRALRAKLWPEGTTEPDWQLHVELEGSWTGGQALVAHDDTPVEFDAVQLRTEGGPLTALRERLDQEREQRRRHRAQQLRLKVRTVVGEGAEGLVHRLYLAPHVGTDRVPLDGRLVVIAGEREWIRAVVADDIRYGRCVLELPPLPADTELLVLFDNALRPLEARHRLDEPRLPTPLEAVRRCVDILIDQGRDRYGSEPSPLIMAVLDVDLDASPRDPPPLDAMVRLEGRLHRRAERGSNFWYDQALLRVLHRLTEIDGEPRYAQAADDYARHFLEHCRKDVDARHLYLNGMPCWGSHVYWDCWEERPAGDGDGNGPHEILLFRGEWERLYRLDPDRVRAMVEGLWRHHVVDPVRGRHNRHDDGRPGCDFAFSGSTFAHAHAVLAALDQDAQALQRAAVLAAWHGDQRHPETGLVADCPGLPQRYDGQHCFTTLAGPFALSMLACWQRTGEARFRDLAFDLIESYDRHAWDPAARSYAAMLRLDGTPVPARAKGEGYDAYAPTGPVEVWRTCLYSYEFTLAAAQAAVHAARLSENEGEVHERLRRIAHRWVEVVARAGSPAPDRRWRDELEAALPDVRRTGGSYAEDYGRAISLFVHLHRLSAEDEPLQRARALAAEAIDKLHHGGLFRGHPAKPYYETTNGVGLLLLALLELHDPRSDLGGAW